jgi:hypothetical protein
MARSRDFRATATTKQGARSTHGSHRTPNSRPHRTRPGGGDPSRHRPRHPGRFGGYVLLGAHRSAHRAQRRADPVGVRLHLALDVVGASPRWRRVRLPSVRRRRVPARGLQRRAVGPAFPRAGRHRAVRGMAPRGASRPQPSSIHHSHAGKNRTPRDLTDLEADRVSDPESAPARPQTGFAPSLRAPKPSPRPHLRAS